MKMIMALIALLLFLSSTACIVYGKGESFGYITTVEQGILWDRVWSRADYTSSQTDCWLIAKRQPELVNTLKEAAIGKKRVALLYNRHFFAVDSGCGKDEVAGVTTPHD